MTAALYHYTCRDSYPGILAAGVVRPNYQPVLDRALVWLTDLDVPDRSALGLTSITLSCDRTERRVEVPVSAGVPWRDYFKALPKDVRRQAAALHYADGVLPAHWWISETAVPLIRTYPAVAS